MVQAAATSRPRGPGLRGCTAAAALLSVVATALPCAAASDTAWFPDSTAALPSSQDWLQHLKHDLLRFWCTAEAKGNPPGDFPTMLHRNGDAVRPDEPLRDRAGGGMRGQLQSLGQQFAVDLSRQTYLYGVAYHMTGDPEMLRLCKAGVDRVLATMREPNGPFYDWVDRASGQGGPDRENRGSVQAAYAMLGPSFYYYLTRDPAVLEALVQGQRWNERLFGGMRRWEYYLSSPNNREWLTLGTQLDHINAYLLLLTPLLPPRYQRDWQRALDRLVRCVMDRFYCPEFGSFVAGVEPDAGRPVSNGYRPVGFEAKGLWFLYVYARRTGDTSLLRTVQRSVDGLVRCAFVPWSGSWADNATIEGPTEESSSLFPYAEMDQLVATVNLSDTTYERKLAAACRYYFREYVDHEYGGIWLGVSALGDGWTAPKARPWKSGFHESEHCLVGYVTSAGRRGEKLLLYYAFAAMPRPELVQPYYFNATVDTCENIGEGPVPGTRIQRVTFSHVH